VLDLSELGHVDVGGFFAFLSLSLVGLDLDLELVDEVLESDKVLLVFLSGVDDFLELSLELLLVLESIGGSLLLGVKLVLEFSDTLVELLDLLFATLHGDLLGFVESELEILDGGLHVLLHSFKVSGLVLLLLEFLGHHSGVGDSLLGLLLSVSLLRNGFLDFGLGGLEFLLDLSLGVDEGGVLGVEKGRSLVGFEKLGLSKLSTSFSLLKGASEFLKLAREEVGSSVNNGNLFSEIFGVALRVVNTDLEVLVLLLKSLHALLSFAALSVSMSKLNLKVVEVRFHLLLGSDSFTSGSDFGVEGGLHRFDSSLSVSSAVVDFLVLLGKSSLEVLLDLGNFNLESENLGFFRLDSGFSFFKGGLEFVSLNIDGSLVLLELVDRFAGFSELVGEVSDFFLEVLVFSFDSLKGVKGFFVGVLGLEKLGGEGSGFFLGLFEFGLDFFLLLLGFGKNLVEVSLLLVELGSGLSGSLELDGEVFDLSSLSRLGLLERSALSLGCFDGLFGFLESSSKLLLSFLELLSSLNSVGLVLGSPLRNFSVGLGERSLEFSLGLLLFFILLLDELVVVSSGLDGVGESTLGLRFFVEVSLKLLDLLSLGVLGSGELGDELFFLLDLSVVLLVISLESTSDGVELVDFSGKFILLGLGLVELILEVSAHLFERKLVLGDSLDVGSEIIDLHLHFGLLLLELLLDSLEVVDGLGHLSSGIGVLLSESRDLGLVGEVRLFEITSKLSHLGFSSLVELDLGSSLAASFFKTLRELLEFSGEIRSLLLNLGSHCSLGLEFFLKFFSSSLEFLDLLLELAVRAISSSSRVVS